MDKRGLNQSTRCLLTCIDAARFLDDQYGTTLMIQVRCSENWRGSLRLRRALREAGRSGRMRVTASDAVAAVRGWAPNARIRQEGRCSRSRPRRPRNAKSRDCRSCLLVDGPTLSRSGCQRRHAASVRPSGSSPVPLLCNFGGASARICSTKYSLALPRPAQETVDLALYRLLALYPDIVWR